MTVTTRPPRTAPSPTRDAPQPPACRPPAPERGAAAALPQRREGPEKLTGAALYTDDLVFPGAWYGATIRSTEPHARLLSVALDPAFDASQVVLVTARDVPGENIVSLISDDQPALADTEIRHHAEPIALLAAPDPDALRRARAAVRVRTEPLPAVFDPLESTQEFAHFKVGQGDVEAAFALADLVIEGSYRVGHQEQLYIENNAMIAVPRDDGGVTVHGSLQCPYYVHKALKRALALTDDQAVVVQAETGGGFGGKEEYPSIIAIHAALLARRVGKPVRMIYDRHEDLAATTKRHPAIVTYRTGVTRDGELLAQDIEVVMDGGAYSTLTPVVLSRGTLHAGGPYRCPNVRIRGRAVATNTPPNGAFRGFGAPQTQFAAEMQANRVAEALGISPLELRRRWVYREGDTTPTGQVLRESVGGEEVLERAAEASEFERARAATKRARQDRASGNRAQDGADGDQTRADRAHGHGQRARTASGVGLALAWHGAGFTGSGEVKLASVASVELTADARIRILTASTEMGQGTKTIFPQLAAGILGVPYEAVETAPQDTSIVPDSGPTVASRTAMVVGGLVIKACHRLREQIESETGRPFADSYPDYARQRGALRIDQRFEPYANVHFDDDTYRGDAYPCYGWAAAVAAVDVDLDTGEVSVRSVVAADDVGKAIHPVLAEGQVEGGTLQ
ncbi:MAG: xanthine dehydrogenase family protein, partial [Chloroflexi bacterium]|nr:xanthine dehydrogenase family protein [Chloroflexota bacterium]